MALTNDLISQFVKATKDDNKPSTESTHNGIVVEYNGKNYVRLDGSDLLTPASATIDAKPGDRVTITIKNHNAVVTGNYTSPAARVDDVRDLGKKLVEFEVVVADKVSTKELEVANAKIDELEAEDIIIKGSLTAANGRIDTLEVSKLDASVANLTYATISDLDATNANIYNLSSTYATITRLEAAEATIRDLETDKLSAAEAALQYATIANLNATNATITSLQATHGQFETLTANNFAAINADISSLNTDKLSATDAALQYANIDFANIGDAAIENLYSKSGIIKDLVVSNGVVSGELTVVTINGDRIIADTIVADKLVTKGDDGLYYKLNVEGGATVSEEITEEQLQNGLSGKVIIAKSIAADRISVTDLVAFGATIGGFKITDDSLYSGVKESVDNTTEGVYLSSNGQMNIGDASNFIKYYIASDGSRILDISADNINVMVNGVKDDTDERINELNDTVEKISHSLSALITDANGQSLMTQTANGWTFSMESYSQTVSDLSASLGELEENAGSTEAAVGALQTTVDGLQTTAEYVRIGLYENEACIELGKSQADTDESVVDDFKLVITKTRIMFMNGANIPTYISTDGLVTQNITIEGEGELRQGNWVWKQRSNGNYGLQWREVTD